MISAPRIVVVSVIFFFPMGLFLLFIRQRRGLHHQCEKSNRYLGYEGVTSVQLRHISTGQRQDGCVETFIKQQEGDWLGRAGSVSCNHLEQLVDELNLSPNGLRLSPLEDRRSDCLLHDLFRRPVDDASNNRHSMLSCYVDSTFW